MKRDFIKYLEKLNFIRYKNKRKKEIEMKISDFKI